MSNKDLSNDKTLHKSTNVPMIPDTAKCRKSVCTATQAIELLDELRKSYQGLPQGQRKQVKAFIRELSCTAIS